MAHGLARGGVFAPAIVLLSLALMVAAPASAYPERTAYDRTFSAPGLGAFLLADVTADGVVDLVAVDEGAGTIWFYEGTTLGIPRDPTFGVPVSPILGIAVADLDGDLWAELVVVTDADAFWIRWQGFGPEVLALGLNVGGGGPVATGDLNGDGRDDLAALGATGAQVWFQRTETERFPSKPDLVFGSDVTFQAVVVGDVNGDGRDDLVLAMPFEVRVYGQEARGLGLEPMRLVPGGAGDAITAALVGGSGGAPILVAVTTPTGDAVGVATLWEWDGEGLSVLTTFEGPYAARAAVGDANDDRRPDLALATVDGAVTIFYQRSGQFSLAAPDITLHIPEGAVDVRVAIGDANGDEFQDILLRTAEPERFFVFLQEDAVPAQIRTIPDTFALDRGTVATRLIDLRHYFVDDHNRLTFEVVHESNPDLVRATVDGDALTFHASEDYGMAELVVSAWDGNLAHLPVDSNTFSVVVNDPPLVTSTPPSQAVAGETYAYLAAIRDRFPLEDVHVFSLVDAPDGMAVDAATGLVTWSPSDRQIGSHAVEIEVRDAYGGVVVQRFTVVVGPNPSGAVLLLAVGIIATSTALLAAATLLSENAKWILLLFVLPLYSKIKRERVLDHFVRGQIYGYIQANPGEHYNAIRDALGLTNGSLAHHLRTLEREAFIKSKRFGLYRRFYPMHMRIPEDDVFQPNDVQRMILDAIRRRPGINQKQIADRLGLTPPTVNYHVSVLSDRNLIRVVRKGRSTHCSIAEEGT